MLLASLPFACTSPLDPRVCSRSPSLRRLTRIEMSPTYLQFACRPMFHRLVVRVMYGSFFGFHGTLLLQLQSRHSITRVKLASHSCLSALPFVSTQDRSEPSEPLGPQICQGTNDNVVDRIDVPTFICSSVLYRTLTSTPAKFAK